MEYRQLNELKGVADVRTDIDDPGRLSRAERLDRWAQAVESQAGRPLRPLYRVEFVTPEERATMSAFNSPLTIAFEDEQLRREGLKSDRLGDAMDFFELSVDDAHSVVCDCYYHGMMAHREVARRIRAIAAGPMSYAALNRRIGMTCLWLATAAVLGMTLL